MSEKTKVLVTVTDDLLAWLDERGREFDRDRSWLIGHAVEMWRKRLERDRKAAERKAARRAGR